MVRRFTTQLDEAPSLAEGAPLPRILQNRGTNVAALVDLLDQEVARAQRYGRELSIAVFQMPLGRTRGRHRVLESALRCKVRGSDIPVRISDTTFAVILPETGHGVVAATERIEHLLSEMTHGPVSSGCARFPIDAVTAPELLREAMRQARAQMVSPAPGELADAEVAVAGERPALTDVVPQPSGRRGPAGLRG
jgi:hypothetical protein